jgi:EmrB/QacA subfamily drug resistance transporter
MFHHTAKTKEKSGYLLNNNRKWLVLLAVGAGTFMTALDGSVVNTILPVVNRDFKSDIAIIEWVIVVYLLLISGLLPTFGRIGDIKGHKAVYISGFAIFISASTLCAFSPSVYMLIVSRSLQSIGAAMLSANSPAILTKSFPSDQRGQALGLQATMTYLGLTVGPALGGWLTDQFSWRAVFFINLPVGLIAFILSALFIAREFPGISLEGFDLFGAMIFMAGLIALLLGLNQGHDWGWASPLTISVICIAFTFLGIFIYIEQKVPYPLLDLKLFKNRLFSTSVVSAILNYICVSSSLFLMPFYLIQGLGFSPSRAGIYLSTQPIIMALVAPLSGTLSDRFGTRIPTTLGMSIITVSLFFLSRIGPTTQSMSLILTLALLGLGIGIFISPNNSALLGSAPPNRQGIAAGLLATARNIGMVLGVGLAGAIFTTTLNGGNLESNMTLFKAVRSSFLAAMVIAILGVVISLIKGEITKNK